MEERGEERVSKREEVAEKRSRGGVCAKASV
jgi:hypothetical protein